MPFRKRHLAMLRDWEPDEQFDPEVDRLLVTMSNGDLIVIKAGPREDEGTSLVLDMNYLPLSLANVAKDLRHRTVPLEWRADMYPWDIFVFDGTMTWHGPTLAMQAVGLGWSRTIDSRFIIEQIEPVRVEQPSRSDISLELSGLTFGEYCVNEEAMYNEALPKTNLRLV